ncbi:two-component system sensor histidine kinase YesM [Aequitasia blattaphilus]|uniref:Sensor histidine kinase n=1 Tax=Aequitasia blattaphilus TaxID=2949332 RepID=A0ABT1EAX7_9FIRM|nr:sensor histidine kinase [Aequitasia blattaphilus]MCP1102985.1 sensor histidine kinase [Aequitasia blattaphilus]MCR8615625.1 sensor histidine kinase [Aequitasia blattaphilus]
MKRSMTLRKKLILAFTSVLILASTAFLIASIWNFTDFYESKSAQFIGDLTKQTSTNMEENIRKADNITFELLKNTVVQNLLIRVNQEKVPEYELIEIRKQMINEMGTQSLFNKDVISMSIFSTSGLEFSIDTTANREVKQMFSEDEIYEAKGSTLWKITDDSEHNICIARGIFGLKSQKPIGYINIIIKEAYFGEIIQNISGTYTSGVYVVDKEQMIVSSNNKDSLGKYLPGKPEDEKIVIDDVESYVYTDQELENGWRLVVSVPVNEINKDMLKLGIFACVIVIFASGIAVLIVISLIKKSIKPLEQLKESMKQIGKGDFSSRVEVIADDEIGQLGNTYNSMAQNIETLIEKAYMLELAKKEAEIEFLKMQINPHFLYNTLDTISWMARTQNHIEISEVAMALGDLLRSNLKQKSMITIGEELKSVRNYVFIQEYRFGDKIQVEYEVDQGVKDYLIPNFILQPLVENSIIHGLEPKVEKGLLMVQIFIHEGQLFFRVVDDGIGMNQETISNIYYACEHETSKKCIGIKNVYRRLKLYYGEEGTLRISSEVGKGSRICFSIPMDKLEKVGEHK